VAGSWSVLMCATSTSCMLLLEHRGPKLEHRGPKLKHRGPKLKHRGPKLKHRGPKARLHIRVEQTAAS
jgi:hypothetical protein